MIVTINISSELEPFIHSFIHLIIHYTNLYSTSSMRTNQKRSQKSARPNNIVLSCLIESRPMLWKVIGVPRGYCYILRKHARTAKSWCLLLIILFNVHPMIAFIKLKTNVWNDHNFSQLYFAYACCGRRIDISLCCLNTESIRYAYWKRFQL